MLLGGIYAQNDILGAAMQANAMREEVHVHNLTNNDTPGYKKYSVAFEDQLRLAVDKYKEGGDLDLSLAVPLVNRIHTNLSSRIDGNNVDINEENTSLYQASVIYDAVTNSVISNYRQLDLVFQMRG